MYFLDAGIEIAQDLTPNLMEITGVVTSRLKTRRCGIFFCGLAMKLMPSTKKMAAKIPLKIKWSGVNTAENVGQGTMGNAPNHTLKIVFYKKKYAIPPTPNPPKKCIRTSNIFVYSYEIQNHREVTEMLQMKV